MHQQAAAIDISGAAADQAAENIEGSATEVALPLAAATAAAPQAKAKSVEEAAEAMITAMQERPMKNRPAAAAVAQSKEDIECPIPADKANQNPGPIQCGQSTIYTDISGKRFMVKTGHCQENAQELVGDRDRRVL